MRTAYWFGRFRYHHDTEGSRHSEGKDVADPKGNIYDYATKEERRDVERNRGRCRNVSIFDCGKTRCWACHYEKFYGNVRRKTHRERIATLDFGEQLAELGLEHLNNNDCRYNVRCDPSWVQSGLYYKECKDRKTFIGS
jgi:hypothetical protein